MTIVDAPLTIFDAPLTIVDAPLTLLTLRGGQFAWSFCPGRGELTELIATKLFYNKLIISHFQLSRNFSAGLDFGSTAKEVYSPEDSSQHIPSYFGQRQFSLMATRLIAIPQMVVAAAHGPTVGVGFALFCASDVRIASEDWRGSIGANRMGLSGGEGGLSWLLPRLVGTGLTVELMATHRWLDAPRALQRGLINEMVKTKDDLRPAARQFAKDMLALSQTGLILTKQINQLVANGCSMQGAIAAEDSAQMMAAADPEASAMMRAFQGGIVGGKKDDKKAKL